MAYGNVIAIGVPWGPFAGGVPFIFEIDFTKGLLPIYDAAGTGYTANTDTAGEHTHTNHKGRVRRCLANEMRMEGSRRVENREKTHATLTGWITSGGSQTGPFTTGPIANVPSYRFTSSGAIPYWYKIGSLALISSVTTYYLRASKAMSLYVLNASGAGPLVDVTTQWQRFSCPVANQTSIPWVGVFGTGGSVPLDAGDWIEVSAIQVEDVSDRSNKNPSEYVSYGVSEDHGSNVDGVKYFNTENGNTVSTNLVVVGAGAAIADAVAKGVVIEDARTNIELNSDDFTAGDNGGTGATLGDGTGSDYGLDNLSVITNVGAVTDFWQTPVRTITGNQYYTVSAIFKAGTATATRLRVQGSGAPGSGDHSLYFNPVTGAITAVPTTPEYQANSAFVEALGDGSTGFWRVGFTIRSHSGDTGLRFRLYGDTAVAGRTMEWGALQIENSRFPTSFIPTAGSSVIRDITLLEYSGDDYNSTATMYVEFDMPANPSFYTNWPSVFTLQNAAGNGYITAYIDTGKLLIAAADVQFTTNPSQTVSAGRHKLAITWQRGGLGGGLGDVFNFSIDGGAVVKNTEAAWHTVPTEVTITEFHIGNFYAGGNYPWSGTIHSVWIKQGVSNDAALQALST